MICLLLMSRNGYLQEVANNGSDFSELDFFDKCETYDFDIQAVPLKKLPYMSYSLKAVKDTTLSRDYEGVMYIERGGRLYYHPVAMCKKAYTLLAAYHDLGDTTFLKLAEKYARRPVKEAMVFDSALYYPYHFDFKVHARDDAMLHAPWFSGMAQGEILGLLTRTFTATGDSFYLENAHRTFNSFLRLKGKAEPWTVFEDSCGCYWIEEYPTDPPSMTFNGFMFALFGLYDYYQLTKSPEAEKILKAGLSTLKNYLPLFRRRGGPSFYGLTFRRFSSQYHKYLIGQLKHLKKMSGDDFFGDWADTLKADYFEKGW